MSKIVDILGSGVYLERMSNILDKADRKPFPQKSAIATTMALAVAYGAYAAAIAFQLRSEDVVDVAYKLLMIVATVLLAIIMAFTHGVMAAFAPSDANAFDERDRDLSWRAGHVGGYVLAAGVFAALTLTLFEVDYFYIANVLLLAWVIAEITTNATLVVLYRRAS